MTILLLPFMAQARKLEAHAVGAQVNAMSLIGLLSPALISCAGAPGEGETTDTDIVGQWRVEDIDHGGVIDDVMISAEFSAEGRVSGRGGCNSYGGVYTRSGEVVTVSAIASTKMACAPALMNFERKFFDRLEGELVASISPDGALILGDDEGRILLRRMDNE